MKADGLTLEDLQKVQRGLANRGDSGVYETFSELGGLAENSSGANLRGLAMALGSVPGPAQEAILARVAQNAEQLPKRTSRAASRATGQDASKAAATLDELEARLKQDSVPLYDNFYAAPVDEAVYNAEIAPILDTQQGRAAKGSALRNLRTQEASLKAAVASGRVDMQSALARVTASIDSLSTNKSLTPEALDHVKRAFDDQIEAAGQGSYTASNLRSAKRNFAESVSRATGGTYGEALGFYEGGKRLEEAFDIGLNAMKQPTWQLERAMNKGNRGSPFSAGEVEAIAMGVARHIEDLIEANDQAALTKLMKGKALKNLSTALDDPKAAAKFEQSIQRLAANREWGRRVSGGSDTAMRLAAVDDASRLEEDPITRALDRAANSTAPPSVFGAAWQAVAKPAANAATDAYRRLKYPGIRDEEVNAALAPMMGNAMTKGNLDQVASTIEARLAAKNPKRLPPPPGGPPPITGPKGPPKLSAPAASAASPPRPPVKMGFGSGSKQPLPMDEAGGKNYIDQAVEHFGVTDDLREAGYLLPDGRMLDLSGRHDMLGGDYVRQDGRNVATGRDWQAGVRHTDHRELPFDVQEAKANEANFGNTSTAHMLGFQKETGAIRIMPGTGISVSVMPSDKQIKALVTRWRRTYGNDPMLIDVDDAVTGKNLTSIDVQRVTVEDVKNALRQAPSPPSQSGSSKLLAGMGASPEAVGGIGGGVAGYFGAQDTNDDGVVDASERAAQGLGGMASGIALAKGGRAVGNALKSTPAPRLPAPTGPVQATFGGVKAKTADLPMDAASQRARGAAQGFDMDKPLYHGTASDFEAFDKAMRGKVFKDGDARQAFFFSTNPKVASGYADEAAYAGSIDKRNADPAYQKARQEWKDTLGKKNWMGQIDRDKQLAAQDNLTSVEKSIDMTEGAAVLPVYSRLRNPYVVDDIKEYDNTLFREAIDYAQANGHDGVIFKNVRDEVGKGGAGPSDIYAVFDPENIRGKFAKFDPAKTDSPIMMNGFGGPPKPQANALKGPPKKPAPVLSRAAEEATRELKAARRAFNTASNKWVMKDDRELRVKPLEDRVVAAEAKLAQVLKNDARLKTLAARGRSIIESPDVKIPIKYGVGGTALGFGALVGANALMPKERGEKPMSPKDPRWFWSTVVNDKDTMVGIQAALRKWDEWPQEEITLPNGAKVMKDVEMTGRFGKATKDALRSWRYSRGMNADDPMSKQDLVRLLAGPKGFQSDDGSWRYGTDGARVSPP